MMYSIRKRLLVLLLLITGTIGLISLVGSYMSAQHEVQELFDAQLAQSAKVLRSLLIQPIRKGRVNEINKLISEIPYLSDNKVKVVAHGAEAVYGHEYESKIAFQVWQKPEKMIFHSSSAPKKGFSHSALVLDKYGYSDELIDNQLWRVFSLPDTTNTYVFKVGELYEVRNELIQEISLNLIASSVIGIVMLAGLIWIAIGHGLLPLNKIAREISQRTPNDLTDIDLTMVPREIMPLVDSLNDLFERVALSLENERRFTDDAAHELRTPLAALKTQVQVALRTEDSDEQQQTLKKIVAGVDRATHLVEQLLELARSQNEQYRKETNTQKINLYTACSEILANIMDMNDGRVNCTLSGDTDTFINMNSTGLSVMLRNVIDNAVRYSPDNGQVDICISKNNDSVILTVADNGPGIPEDLQQRVFDRFYRAPGTHKSGSGLGLAIAKQVSQSNNVAIQLSNKSDSTGLVVTFVFQPAK